jgi:hypothetical protein
VGTAGIGGTLSADALRAAVRSADEAGLWSEILGGQFARAAITAAVGLALVPLSFFRGLVVVYLTAMALLVVLRRPVALWRLRRQLWPATVAVEVAETGLQIRSDRAGVTSRAAVPWTALAGWFRVDGALVLLPADGGPDPVVLPLQTGADRLQAAVAAHLQQNHRFQRAAARSGAFTGRTAVRIDATVPLPDRWPDGIRWEASLTRDIVAAVDRVRVRAATPASAALWLLGAACAGGAAAALSRSAHPAVIMCLASAALLLACHRRIADIGNESRAARWFERAVPPSATYAVSAGGAGVEAEVRSTVVSCAHPWPACRAWYALDGAIVLVPAERRGHTLVMPLADNGEQVRNTVGTALPLDTRLQRVAIRAGVFTPG